MNKPYKFSYTTRGKKRLSVNYAELPPDVSKLPRNWISSQQNGIKPLGKHPVNPRRNPTQMYKYCLERKSPCHK